MKGENDQFLESAIVTFVDIIGFREIARSKSLETIKTALDLFKYFAAPQEVEVDNAFSPIVYGFSDTIVRVFDINSKFNASFPTGMLFHELLDLVRIQGNLINNGLIVRGGVSFGKVGIGDNRVYGPAYIEAYDIESKIATYPRIVVSPKLLEEYKTNKLLKSISHTYVQDAEYVYDLLKKGDDGYWFIDYLSNYPGEMDDPGTMCVEFLRSHQNIILEGAKKMGNSIEIQKKIVWLYNYHDSTIRNIPSKSFTGIGEKKQDYLIGKLTG